jgi:hypothetical protein
MYLRDAWLRQAPQDERGTKTVKIEGFAVIGPAFGLQLSAFSLQVGPTFSLQPSAFGLQIAPIPSSERRLWACSARGIGRGFPFPAGDG